MGSWAVMAFECERGSDRRRLLRWFERTHPVTVPVHRYSTTGALETPGGTHDADFAWIGRYLYVTTPGDPRAIVTDSVGRWDRAVVAEIDRASETVVDGRFVDATDGVTGHRVRGAPGWAGVGLLYALAMARSFRFRPCASRAPPDSSTPHPTAFADPADFLADLDRFVDRMRAVTGIAPTDAGLTLLRSDPAGRDRFVYDGPGGSPTLDLGAEDSPRADADRPLVETDGGAPVGGDSAHDSDTSSTPEPDRDGGLVASLLGDRP